ncbi:MAG: tryptophan synthase subunit beta [Candidatus Woesearchaeota archaeon]
MRMKTKYGSFGGVYVPEMMVPAMEELESAFITHTRKKSFGKRLQRLLKEFGGRPTPLYFAERISHEMGFKIYIKREDLLHTGAHKINNTVGQGLLAEYMGKEEIIGETGAGQHGVATAVAGALLDMPVKIFMGEKDIKRQELNVFRMKLFGAEVIPVKDGSRTLKDAVNEALRYFLANTEESYYLLGSVVGPHPYPTMVRMFQRIIGTETRKQILRSEGRFPTAVVACVGGGSNALGIFDGFSDSDAGLIGVEAGGSGGRHCRTLSKGTIGVFQGSKSYLIQDNDGQAGDVHSIAAGLDYPGVGPLHSFMKESKRAEYSHVSDKEALEALKYLCRKEGILPALESAHAVAYVLKNKASFSEDDIVIINLSGRGDKDVSQIMESESKGRESNHERG